MYGSHKKLDQGAASCSQPPILDNDLLITPEIKLKQNVEFVVHSPHTDISRNTKSKILSEVNSFFNKLRKEEVLSKITLEDKILENKNELDSKICDSIEVITEETINKLVLSLEPNQTDEVANVTTSFELRTGGECFELSAERECLRDSQINCKLGSRKSHQSYEVQAGAEGGSCANMEDKLLPPCLLTDENERDIEQLSFHISESIKSVDNHMANQLFSPVRLGHQNEGIKTFIQLDSGATTNLMGAKMGNFLLENKLINFVYPYSRSLLTDVQHNEIIQPLKPINITLLFDNIFINACFHIVQDLEYPLLGLSTMLNNDMSILNEKQDSYLVIGQISQPKAIVKNVRNIQDELLSADNVILQPGINFVKCNINLDHGVMNVTAFEDFKVTCLQLPKQTIFVDKNSTEICIKNLSSNNCELFGGVPLAIASQTIINNVLPCNKVDSQINELSNEDDEHIEDRFKFPLSEEEGRKLLASAEPFSFPLYEEGEEEEIIDWKKELGKEGVFPTHLLDEFIEFVEKEIPNIFSRTEYDCGKLDRKYGFVEDLPMITDRPIASPPMNIGPIRSAQIRSTFNRLEANGIVEKGLSPYATPCFVVPKITSNRTRMVADFRELNSHCETLKMPVKRLDGLNQDIANASPEIFSLVDICNAFHAMELGTRAGLKCAIITSDCQYIPKRVIFGYKNAPALFLQAMAKLFAELPRAQGEKPFCDFYFDDIIIFSKNEREHLRHLKIVLSLLAKAGLKIQANKNQFFKPKIELLGKVISGTTISPQKRHIDSLQRFPRPSTIKQLQSFLGICTWNCNLVPDYSRTIQPLTKLLRKDEPFVWGKDQEDTFQYLKQYFTERTALYFVDYSQPIYVAADASDRFIAGIAYQIKSYSAEEIPILQESLKHTKELHKLPPPKYTTNHPLLPKGAIGIPSPFKLTSEGIKSPHDASKILKEAQSETISNQVTEEYLDSKEKLHIICNVGYFSSSLSKSQEGYSIIEKEAFAVMCSLEFFKPLLQGAKEVYVLSDSRPFLFIMKMMKCGISRIQRWSLKLFSMPYTIIMVHIKGTVNYSDSLTRVWAVEECDEPKPDMKKAIMVESPFKVGQLITYDDLVEVLEKNPDLVKFSIKEPSIKLKREVIKNITCSREIKYVGSQIINDARKMISTAEIMNHQRNDSFCRHLKESNKYYKYKDIWYKKRLLQTELNDEGRAIVPRNLVSPVIALFHLENHSGVNNLYDQIKSVYYFPNMRATITEFIKMCHLCAVYKSSTAPKIPIAPRELDPVPKNTVWSFDIIDGFPKHRNSGSILSMVEYHSGYRIITPLRATHSSEIARIVEKEIIATFGPPRLMITDGGTNLLRSKNFKKLTYFYGVQSYVTSPYHPASHGRVEVSHRAIITLIKIASEHLQRPWFDICSFVQIALNSRPSSTLGGHSPMYFMFGNEPTYRLRNNLKLSDIPDVKEQEKIWKDHDEANKKILKEYNIQRNKLNKRIGGKMVEYNKGDFIWARNYVKSPKQKIQSRYLMEPLEIVKDFGYALLAKNHLGVVLKLHKNNVKRYYPRDLELYNALPFRIKIKLGSKFDQKDLHKYYDQLHKEEEDLIESYDNNDSNEKLIDKKFDDEVELDSDDEELDEAIAAISNTTNNNKTNGSPGEPNLPFHMRLRNRKVQFK